MKNIKYSKIMFEIILTVLPIFLTIYLFNFDDGYSVTNVLLKILILILILAGSFLIYRFFSILSK
jgi:hypothetical protein